MKKVFVLMITVLLAFALSACNRSTGNDPAISADEALNIALEQAGVTRDDIRDLENTLDTENGVLVYEIDFDAGNVEYSYDVNAQTGDIVERDRDREN